MKELLALGECEVELEIAHSAVDSFVYSGYKVATFEDLTTEECDILTEDCLAEIQAYAYENGSRCRD